ncbi:MAG: HAD family hydrolase [Pseudohongiellaceae bacterium]
MTQKLALFDLDNTLLDGDSDHAWGEFLIGKGLVDAAAHRAENDRHYAAYKAGELDIHAYVRFTLAPLLDMSSQQRQTLHAEYMRECVAPMILPAARELVRGHQGAGDCCVIITATNKFVTAPIAREFGVEHLLATELEEVDGRFTGEISGTPCFQEGKVVRLNEWLRVQHTAYELEQAVFYTDSVNDLPLLRLVGKPVAVDPDSRLKDEAERCGWAVQSLR